MRRNAPISGLSRVGSKLATYADVRYIDDVISHSVGTTSHTLALTKMCGMTASDGPPLQRTGPLLLKRWMLCVESLA